jgi:hypothetical protein
MPDYKQGKIYTIRSPNTDKYYIGSTTQPLHKRFYEHKMMSYETTVNVIFDAGDAYIELMELCSCNSKNELDKREGELQREHKDKMVNKNIAGRTHAEYVIDNKEAVDIYQLQYQSVYREENKEKKARAHAQYVIDNKEKLAKYQKEYYAKKKLEKKNINLI